MRLQLFWSLFLPTNHALSVDAYLSAKRRSCIEDLWSAPAASSAPSHAPGCIYHGPLGEMQWNRLLWPARGVCSVATAAYSLQVTAVYLVAGLYKSHSVWTRSYVALLRGTTYLSYVAYGFSCFVLRFLALSYALNLGYITTPWGVWLLQYPTLLQFGTAATMVLELGSPVLIMSPVSLLAGCYRFIAVGIVFLFHMLTLGVMYIGVFPWIGAVGLIPLLPRQFWDVTTDLVAATWYRLCPRRLPRCLNPPADSTREPYASSSALTFTKTVVVALGAVVTFTWLVWSVFPTTKQWLPPPVLQPLQDGLIHPVALATRLDQNWKMFSPKPPSDDGHWVFPATLRDGSVVDLFRYTGGPVFRDAILPHAAAPNLTLGPNGFNESLPELVSGYMYNDRWRKYLNNLNDVRCQLRFQFPPGALTGVFHPQRKNSKYRVSYGRFICRQWNQELSAQQAEHPHHLMTFQLAYIERVLRDHGKDKPQRVALWSHTCWSKPSKGTTRRRTSMGNSSSVAPRPPGSNVTNSSQLEVQEEVPAPPEQHSREPGSGGAPTQESRREYFERNAAKFRERRIRMREEAAKRARDQHTSRDAASPDVPLEHTPTAPSAKAEMSVAPSGEQSPGTDSDVL